MANIFVVVFLYYFFAQVDLKKWVRFVLLAAMFTLWFIDLNVVNIAIEKEFRHYGDTLDTQKEQSRMLGLLEAKGLAVKDFQAILFLPYFTIGSEKSSICSGGDMLGMKAALYTGLGMVDFEMSRTSLTQTDMNLQLISSPLLRKEVLSYYKSGLPLLLVVRPKEPHSENEEAIIRRGDLIGSTFIFPDTLMFYTLPLSAFADSSPDIRGRYDQMMSEMDRHNGYLSSGQADNVVSQGYDDRKSSFIQFGSGALNLESKDTVLYEGTLPSAKDSDLYEFSIWNYGDSHVPIYPNYELMIFDQRHHLVAKYEKGASASTDVYRKWLRTNVRFILPSKDYTVRISSGKYDSYDELMIRPLKVNVLTHTSDRNFFMYNNYPIEKK